MTLSQSLTALRPALTASFLASGGQGTITYSVNAGGAGGTIDAATGLYTAPAIQPEDPALVYDTITATDSTTPTPLTATATILVGSPLLLFCDIIQTQLGLANGRVYLWDQKIPQPKDFGLYIAVSNPMNRPFANVKSYDSNGNAIQTLNMMATMDIDIISRGPSARDRKEEVLLAMNSDYAESQMNANSFLIGKLPADTKFLNLSAIDGAAIPYRYKISVNMQYTFTKTSAVPYFNQFQTTEIDTNP